MEIRGERTWCAKCQAPEVWHRNVPTVELFLEALPAWRSTGLDRIAEGFDRAEIAALMDLRGIPPAERPDTWAALAEMEGETRLIRAAKHAAKGHSRG
jgi:hypothetical protein